MKAVINFFVRWLIIPGVMVCLILVPILFARTASILNPQLIAPAWAGFLGGLVFFLIYVVSRLNTLDAPVNMGPSKGILRFSLISTIIGFIVGIIFMYLTTLFFQNKVVGFLILFLTITSTSSLFSYLFISKTRDQVIHFSLSFALGILIYIIANPIPSNGVDKLFWFKF